MNTLSVQNVAHLDGRETPLSSCYSNGKVLTLRDDGKISLENIHPLKNQKWRMVPQEGGVYLKNDRGGYVCYSPEKDPEIEVISEIYEEDRNVFLPSTCIWSIGKNGELYQITASDEERYLWVADDHLRVVSDGYLADGWKILDEIKKEEDPLPYINIVSSHPKKENKIIIFFGVVILISILYFLFFLNKR